MSVTVLDTEDTVVTQNDWEPLGPQGQCGVGFPPRGAVAEA